MYAQISRWIKQEFPVLVILSGALCLVSVIVRYLVVPPSVEYTARRHEMEVYREVLSAKDELASVKNQIAREQDSLRTKFDRITQGMGDPEDLSSILGILIGKAEDAGIHFIRKVQPQNETRRNDYILYPVLLEMTTTCESLGKFVAGIESVPHLVRMSRLAVTAQRGGKLDVKVLVTCFLMPK